jgi:hypothetical protein
VCNKNYAIVQKSKNETCMNKILFLAFGLVCNSIYLLYAMEKKSASLLGTDPSEIQMNINDEGNPQSSVEIEWNLSPASSGEVPETYLRVSIKMPQQKTMDKKKKREDEGRQKTLCCIGCFVSLARGQEYSQIN